MSHSFTAVFNPATCLPWWNTPKHLKQGFTESLYRMRSKFVVAWCVAFSVPIIFISALAGRDVSLRFHCNATASRRVPLSAGQRGGVVVFVTHCFVPHIGRLRWV